MSGVVRSVGKAVSSVGKAASSAVKSVTNVVKKVAPIAAPLAMIAFPGVGTALGGMLGATGTTATLLGGGLIGAGAAALGGKNPLTGALMGAGGAYLGNTLGGASGLLGGGAPMGVAGATGLTPGAAGASGLYGIMPATSGYGLAASSLPAYASAVGGALGSTGIFPTAAMNLSPQAGLLAGSNLSNMLRLGGSLLGGQPQQIAPPVQYQRQQPISGQVNFEPTISLLTNYGAI
jgi:hypothetical protein